MNITYIYLLIDPRDSHVKYVGKSNSPRVRYTQHLNLKKITCSKERWTRELIKAGLYPEMEVIQACPKDDWGFWEEHYISLYKSFGFELLNRTSGGIHPKWFSATRERIVGRNVSAETKKKLSEKAKNRKYSAHAMLRRRGPKIGQGRNREVVQLTQDGVRIALFASASKVLAHIGEVGSVAYAKLKYSIDSGRTHKGFNWQWKDGGTVQRKSRNPS